MKYQEFYLQYPKYLGNIQEGESAFILDKDVEEYISKMKINDYYIFASTGIELRDKDPQLKEMLDFLIKISCYTDIRIWPNRMTAIAGNYQNSRSSSIISGTSSFDSKIFGTEPGIHIYDILERLINSDDVKKTIESEKIPYGFNRPNNTQDERTSFFKRKFNSEITNKYRTLRILFEAEEHLFKKKKLKANFSAIMGAVLKELNFKKEEMEAFTSIFVIKTLPLIYIYNRDKIKNGSILPIKSEDIIYKGDYKIGRKWEEDD